MNADSKIQMISIEQIIPNRFQPRLTFDEQGLNELSASIKEHGIIQPLVLRQLGDKYEIIAGERRYKAATMAGFTEVPAIISNLDDNRSAEVALIENVQRRNLTSIEEAKSYKKILDRGYLTQDLLAKRIGVSQSTVANKLRLLNLTEAVQEALMNEQISERHARSLLQITDPEEQQKLLERVKKERLTVRQLDSIIKGEPSGDTKEVANEIKIETEILDMDPSEAIKNEQIETLDFLESASDINTEMSPVSEKSNIFNIFDKPEYPSLEDEKVNLSIDGSEEKIDEKEELFIDYKQEEIVSKIEEVEIINTPKDSFKINEKDLPSVISAYQNLATAVKEAGYQITTEEFDFEDLCQIIIKIEKQAE